MKKLLQRLWTGVVGAVAGGCIGFLAGVVLAFLQVDLNALLWVTAICVGIGLVIGIAIGNRQVDRQAK